MLALKTANALLSVEFKGNNQLALPKAVQRDPIRGNIEHADLILVRRGEKVTVEVPVHLVGEAAPETLVVTEHATIAIEAEATNIPSSIEVSLDGLGVGSQILAKDLVLPEGSSLQLDEDVLVVNITAAQTAEQLEAELAEAEAEAGIEREEPEAAAAAEPEGEPEAETPEDQAGESA
jgi:large subunit ribosomal protein L25